jgi:DNA polymerase-3 subunit delta'
VIDHLALRPYEGDHQVVILPGADSFNPSAGNALLKTLEEPPGQAVLILLARQLTAVLPTIRSRCQVLRLPVPGHDLLQAEAELAGLSPAQADLQARIATAQTGDPSALAADEVTEHVAACFTLWGYLVERNGTPLLAWVEEHLKGQDKEATAAWLTAWLTTFGLWLRDAMLVAWRCEPDRLTFPEVGQRLAATPLPAPVFFEEAAQRLAATYRALAANAQPRLVVGNLLLGLQDDLARRRVSRYHG